MLAIQPQPFLKRKENKFFILFVLYFLLFYMGGYGLIGLSKPGGLYIDSVARYLNIIDWYRELIVKICSVILKANGIENLATDQRIFVKHGAIIHLNYSCLGIGVISCWWALVLSFPLKTRLKVFYLALGTIVINVINISRISFLSYFFSSPLGIKYKYIDHHLIANIITYIAFGILGYFWFQKIGLKQREDAPTILQ